MHSIVMLLLHNSCRYSHIDSNTTFSLGLYSLSLRSVSASVKALLTVLAVLMIWIPPITRTVWKNANRWLNKELHSTYAYIVFRQLSLVVSPDLLVARHFPPRVWRRTSFVIPTLVVRFRKQESTTIPTTSVGMSAERSGVLCLPPLSTAHSAPLHQCGECFSSARASESPGWILPRGLDATEPLPPLAPPPTSLTPPPSSISPSSTSGQATKSDSSPTNPPDKQLCFPAADGDSPALCLICADLPVCFPLFRSSVCG